MHIDRISKVKIWKISKPLPSQRLDPHFPKGSDLQHCLEVDIIYRDQAINA